MSAAAAVSAFKAQFKAKTAVNWEQRHGMVAKKGKCRIDSTEEVVFT